MIVYVWLHIRLGLAMSRWSVEMEVVLLQAHLIALCITSNCDTIKMFRYVFAFILGKAFLG